LTAFRNRVLCGHDDDSITGVHELLYLKPNGLELLEQALVANRLLAAIDPRLARSRVGMELDLRVEL
jgi:hypothetical protein